MGTSHTLSGAVHVWLTAVRVLRDEIGVLTRVQFRIRRHPPPGSPSPPSAPSFSCSSLGELARRYGCRSSTYILRDRLRYQRGPPKTYPSPAPWPCRPA